MKLKKNHLTPLPDKSKEEAIEDKLVRDTVRHRMQAAKVVPSSQGLVADFMTLIHMEMTKMAGRIGVGPECLGENESKHLSRLVGSLDRLIRIEGEVRALSAVDRMDDKELRERVRGALKTLKISDVEVDKIIKNAKDI
jgi:hypothetical protein